MELTGKLSAMPTMTATLSEARSMSGSLSSNVFIRLQQKIVTPDAETQTVTADDSYAGLSAVTVEAIPSDYGHIVFNGSFILVE